MHNPNVQTRSIYVELINTHIINQNMTQTPSWSPQGTLQTIRVLYADCLLLSDAAVKQPTFTCHSDDKGGVR